MAGRPELPNSYIISLNEIVRKIDSLIIDKPEFTDPKQYIDIIIPVWESMPAKVAKYAVWIYNKKIYISQKSNFVEPIEARRGNNTFYIYDKFKGSSHSYKKGYREETIEIPYPEAGVEPIYIPVYWRVN